ARNMILIHWIRVAAAVKTNPTHPHKRLARDHQKALPLGVMPVIALGHAGSGNVHRHLASIQRAKELRKRTTIVGVCLEWIGASTRAVVALESRPELFGKGTVCQAGDS